jgi:hypothetical protein
MLLGGTLLRSSSMSLTAEQRTARARRAADARHHPGADPEALERARTDAAIDEIISRAPKMTPEQAARVGRIFRYAPPRDPGTGAG